MIASEFGEATLHSRVEGWECDHNKHWNARYYARSFQMAAETVAALAGRDNLGLSLIGARHIRYHRELLVGAAVEVRSRESLRAIMRAHWRICYLGTGG